MRNLFGCSVGERFFPKITIHDPNLGLSHVIGDSLTFWV